MPAKPLPAIARMTAQTNRNLISLTMIRRAGGTGRVSGSPVMRQERGYSKGVARAGIFARGARASADSAASGSGCLADQAAGRMKTLWSRISHYRLEV